MKRKTLMFTLSMSNRGSWNDRWSGEDNFYSTFRMFSGVKAVAKADKLLSRNSWHFSWCDGWGATVSVREVSGDDLRKFRRKSRDFAGHDWMVESILACGEIRQTIIASQK